MTITTSKNVAAAAKIAFFLYFGESGRVYSDGKCISNIPKDNDFSLARKFWENAKLTNKSEDKNG